MNYYAAKINSFKITCKFYNGISLLIQGKAWDKKFAKCANSILSLFEDGKFVKVLKDTKVALDVPSDNIGLTWRSQSYDLPLYSGDKLKKGLAELKIEMANGVKIPRVGFGTWQMEGEECANAVLAALKAGYRHIDTAQSYENEKDVQKGIEAALKEGVIGSRDEIFLASKLSEPSAYNEKNAAKAFTSQLRQLKTNYIDMYMLHGPESAKKNLAAWKAMTKLQKEGKIRALGVSNFESEKDLKILSKKQEIKPSYIQNKFSIYNPGAQGIDEKSMLHVAEERGMAFVAYSILNPWPMVLSQMHDPHVIAVSKRYNQTTAQVLNRWALQLNVAIIPKSKRAERIQENARVLEFALGEIDMRLLNGLSTLAQSTSELYPPFVQDVYGLFTADDEVTKSSHDEL